jgi:acyl-CoA reductase-like NAD-dependent aldehyde dehydrogenase
MSRETTVRSFDVHIDGQSVGSRSGRTYQSIDPFTGEPWAEVPDCDASDVDLAVTAARRALHGEWAQYTATRRGKLLHRLGELIARDAAELAELETRDNGKLLREMVGQMAVLPEWFTYFGGLADKVGGSVVPTDKPNFLVYTRNEPVGVVAAITPWNSPLLLLSWKIAPALAAGCTIVVKPSDHTPASTLALARLIDEAGFPPGVVNVVTGWGSETGQALTSHPGVDRIAFTGSTEVGRIIARTAADRLTRTSLELGGKSAHIVFADAEIDAVVNGIIGGVFAATGQTCMAGSRVLVHEDVAAAVTEKLVERASRIKLGDPMLPDTEMGPVANQRQFDTVTKHFEFAVEDGATIRYGGRVDPELGGLFVQPTILTDATLEMRAVSQEIFGPVVAITTFRDEADAIEMANGTDFGLAGAVWTTDIRRGHRVAAAIRAGTVWINAYRVVAPQVPFGGFGLSGWGRENGAAAIQDYTETKSVWVELSGATRDPFVLG